MLEAAIRHLCRKDVKIIAGSLWPACPPLVNQALTEIAAGEFGKKQGIDYVNLGLARARSRHEPARESIRGVYPVRLAGQAIDTMPIMRGSTATPTST
ncbi:MAG: hypothetical protein IPK72_22420 [Candidatus Eisenbacteria bacterium]|nr:hypothetical protein [Candidatus Eisenbacteria bacterium]